MATTGVTVSNEAIGRFNDFQLKRFKSDYIVFKIADGQVVEDCVGDPGDVAEFLTKLPPNEGRYGLVTVNFDTADGRSTSKLVLTTWIPEGSSPKNKMLYAGTKTAVQNAFTHGAQVHATDFSEITEEILVSSCRK
mmetsp:Transcript_28847/g.29181  ORF Transcript_28847/g.29181 Transcript_28847/m.29181 type:complete len:136 (-) Transcript_28847:254-661(-)|eukprot:CAMPEP_0182423118 /NCGR_PEP_ID=MMETSP1167-20130531/9039_1 /TAXON_ID=2988 /ORGANISM="Mallomonas Sp, Strain CCMP3275" /LENGTH=135 /DNA_ID=CAMNT_0024601807 /DNA_START=36 /DNA_END=443 /DNA_ORIENTATION=-